jgi:hypothetical protein
MLVPRPWLSLALPLVIGSTLLRPSAVSAAPADLRYVHQLRSDFTRYDLGPGGVLERLSALSDDALRELEYRERSEARFLRSAVAADLLLIAVLRGDDALRTRLAAAVDIDPRDLFDYLDQELAAVQRAAFEQPAHRARRMLAIARGDAEAELGVDLGVRHDLLLLRRIARLLERQPDPLRALSPLSAEPCAATEGAADAASCGALYARFPAEGRRALAVLEAVGQAIGRVQAATRRDPLARALSPQLRALVDAIGAVTLRVLPQLDAGLQLPVVSGHGSPAPDMVLIVERDGVRIGHVPGARLDALGHLTIVADSDPVLPHTQRMRFEHRLQRWTHPIAEVVELLERFERATGVRPRIAIGSAGDVRAHVLGCVLLSLRRAGHDRALLLARDADGLAATTPMELVTLAETRRRARSGLRVRVRQGGYSVVGFGVRAQRIGRVWRDERFEFDVERLDRALRWRRFKRADVSFMSRAPAEQVTPAVFRLAERTDGLRVVFPGHAR